MSCEVIHCIFYSLRYVASDPGQHSLKYGHLVVQLTHSWKYHIFCLMGTQLPHQSIFHVTYTHTHTHSHTLQAILTKHFFIAEDHAVKSLRQLIDDIASDPELHSHDINVTSRLWVEESQQSHGGGGRGRGKRQVGERINTLSLKTKACTPGIYRYIYIQCNLSLYIIRTCPAVSLNSIHKSVVHEVYLIHITTPS